MGRRGWRAAWVGVLASGLLLAAVTSPVAPPDGVGASDGVGVSAAPRETPSTTAFAPPPAAAPPTTALAALTTVPGGPLTTAFAVRAADTADEPVRDVRVTAAGAPGTAGRRIGAGAGDLQDHIPRTLVTPDAPREITIAATGDVLPHGPVVARARTPDGGYDFTPLLADLRGVLDAADLALCHLETPLARGDSGLSSYPVFNSPPAVADALAAVGYDGCSVASNHSFDQGVDGVDATLDALDAAGLVHTGTSRTEKQRRRIPRHEVDGVDVAHLLYTYGLNGFVLPDDQPWLVNLIDADAILRDAARARRHDADVVVVSLHWGREYVSEPTEAQEELARRLLRSDDVDLLLGHHAHVVQPVERIGDAVVVYGLGNLLSNQSAACCAAATQDGVVVEVTLRGRPDGSFVADDVRYHPTMVRHPERRVVLVREALATDDARNAELRASIDRTTAVIGEVAELADPPDG